MTRGGYLHRWLPAGVAVLLATRVLGAPDFEALSRKQQAPAAADRAWLHQHAELSLREFETQKYLRRALAEIPGVRLIDGDWGTGVVAVLSGAKARPLVAWRTDMDALPIRETTGLPFACTREDTLSGRTVGVMHACGHDCHMTIALGLMRLLSEVRDELPGSVLLIAEPAEEIGAGATSLLEAGLFDSTGTPDCALALHVHPTLPFGQVGSCPGWATGNVDGFALTVRGEGGHGAYPHRGVDPVTLAAQMILAFPAIVAREIDVNRGAVISVGSIHGGSKSNVIPDEITMEATVRTRDDATRDLIRQKIERTVRGLAVAAGAPEPELEYYLGTAAGYNNPELVAQCREVFRRVVGGENEVTYEPAMGGEDFGYFSQRVPGFQFRLGVAPPGVEGMSLHRPDFNPDERVLGLGIHLAAELIWDQLERRGTAGDAERSRTGRR